ncbi:MAG: Rieske (2Fe-2S) protein [Rhodospirillales bacterium]|nr:Rieske (2Fe-2S) protein [Rhodospirillales bacterium]
MNGGHVLCRVDEIADPGAKGFTLDDPAGDPLRRREIFVVRRGSHVYAYINSCPHVGTPLDWRPDQFLSPDRDLIQCATHGARFEIASGYCVAGPCKGKSLTPVAVTVEGGAVIIAE